MELDRALLISGTSFAEVAPQRILAVALARRPNASKATPTTLPHLSPDAWMAGTAP